MKTLPWILTACATIWLMTAQAQEPAPKTQTEPTKAEAKPETSQPRETAPNPQTEPTKAEAKPETSQPRETAPNPQTEPTKAEAKPETSQPRETAPNPQTEPTKTEPITAESKTGLDQFQGLWECVSWMYNGRKGDHIPYQTFYDGNHLILFNKGQVYRHCLVTLDPERTPKAMNTWDLEGPFADMTNRGIYEFDGETLTICVALDRKQDRPGEFTSEVGSKRLLATYKRRQP